MALSRAFVNAELTQAGKIPHFFVQQCGRGQGLFIHPAVLNSFTIIFSNPAWRQI